MTKIDRSKIEEFRKYTENDLPLVTITVNELLDAYDAQQKEINRLREVMKKVYFNGTAMSGNKCASLVEPLYKALEESK